MLSLLCLIAAFVFVVDVSSALAPPSLSRGRQGGMTLGVTNLSYRQKLPGVPFRSSARIRSGLISRSVLRMAAKSGGKVIATPEQFLDQVLSSKAPRPVLVFFSAPWCGPCRLSNPVVRDIMKQFTGRIDVMEVCTDDLPSVAGDAGVVSIPTIQIYFDGELLDTIVGCVARNVLASAVSKILDDLGQGGESNKLPYRVG